MKRVVFTVTWRLNAPSRLSPAAIRLAFTAAVAPVVLLLLCFMPTPPVFGQSVAWSHPWVVDR